MQLILKTMRVRFGYRNGEYCRKVLENEGSVVDILSHVDQISGFGGVNIFKTILALMGLSERVDQILT